jgi:hypothetical protein
LSALGKKLSSEFAEVGAALKQRDEPKETLSPAPKAKPDNRASEP